MGLQLLGEFSIPVVLVVAAFFAVGAVVRAVRDVLVRRIAYREPVRQIRELQELGVQAGLDAVQAYAVALATVRGMMPPVAVPAPEPDEPRPPELPP